jgi:hypothetical protein
MSNTIQTTAVATALFKECSRQIPSSYAIAKSAVTDALSSYSGDKDAIKKQVSTLVAEVQVEAYRRYLAAEASAAANAMKTVLRPLVQGDTADDAFDFVATNFIVLDRFALSLTQSRRSRAGTAFEVVMTALLDALHYPYTAQPKLTNSNPDYVMPSIGWYNSFSTDCIILTCKRTLRERWRQIVTEGSTGTTFFLATIDDGISTVELDNMKARNVILVVPKSIKDGTYKAAHNVVSFEEFFAHHLDPAMARWAANGAI